MPDTEPGAPFEDSPTRKSTVFESRSEPAELSTENLEYAPGENTEAPLNDFWIDIVLSYVRVKNISDLI